MFGDEPYGNYNRILLVERPRRHARPNDIFINPLAWYEEQRRHAARRRNGHAHRPRAQAGRRPADGRERPYDKLRHRHRQLALLFRRSRGWYRRRADCNGVFVFRTLDDCDRIAELRAATCARAAVIGGGLLGLEAARGLLAQGVEVHVVHLARPPDGACSSTQARRGMLGRRSRRWASARPSRARRTTGILGEDRGHRPARSRTARRSIATWSSSSAGIRPNTETRARSRLDRRARHCRRRRSSMRR